MKKLLRSLAISFVLLGFYSAHSYAQNPEFSVAAYKQFLLENQNLTTEKLLSMHPAGLFRGNLRLNHLSSLYADSMEIKYKLTPGEKSLLDKNGFMATERLSFPTFQSAFQDIYNKDLPVMVTSDAILHAFHISYDKILMDMERQVLIPELKDFLKNLHDQIPLMASEYSLNTGMSAPLRDVDLYLTAARKLLGEEAAPYFQDNNAELANILQYVASEQPRKVMLFSSTGKAIDFSQFKPRGHYVNTIFPELASYFKTMMWLGRIEIYLSAPRALYPKPLPEDIQRQTIDAALILEAVQKAGAFPQYEGINGIIQFFVGEQDNVTLPNLKALASSVNVTKASQLLEASVLKSFQDSLKTKSYAFQRILSQIIETGFNSPDSIIPASAFLLFGQRFVIDSYVTAQVVFDKIVYDNKRVMRMLPSSLDVLFTLGNDASAQLLQKDLEKYHYGSNLAALKYLLDSYPEDFWGLSLYNGWLNAIRKLNPEKDRTRLPLFMQTASWWQQKMNTQLASWAQLRHDNLLYAKQSYSGMATCAFPYVYVEPVPEFFLELKKFAERAGNYFALFNFKEAHEKTFITQFFQNAKSTYEKLAAVAQKELDKTPLAEDEISFLKGLVTLGGGCGQTTPGWYSRLFYNGEGILGKDGEYVIADIHTSPVDEMGNPVGWVLHVATGPVNMGIFSAETPQGQSITFAGPLLSYYEHLTTNFRRLTDEEWTELYKSAPPMRPEFVNSYLADRTGNERPVGMSLVTSINDNPDNQLPESMVIAQNYPNPFNSSTVIRFSIPQKMANGHVTLKVYNALGAEIKQLLGNSLPAGSYLTRWDGTDNNGQSVASGVYFYHLSVDADGVMENLSGKMMLLK